MYLASSELMPGLPSGYVVAAPRVQGFGFRVWGEGGVARV